MTDDVQMRNTNRLSFTSGKRKKKALHDKNVWRRQMFFMMLHLYAQEDR